MKFGVDYKELNKDNKTPIKYGLDLVQSELELLIGMSKYDLFFGNGLGLNLEKYLHLTNKTAIIHLIKDDIAEMLRTYNKASLRELRIEFENDTKLKITILVFVKEAGQLLEVPFSIED